MDRTLPSANWFLREWIRRKPADISWLNHAGGISGDRDSQQNNESLPEARVKGALKHRAMASLVDNLLKEAVVHELTTKVMEK